MRKTLARVGNSLGVILDRRLRERLKIERDTVFELTTDGTSIILTRQLPVVAVAAAGSSRVES